MSSIGAACFIASLVSVLGCVDKEPGLAVTARSASVRVEGSGESTVVGADLALRLHVGKHALAGRNAITIQNVDLFADDRAVARLSAERPPGFDDSLEPGETRSFAIAALSPEGAFADARDTMCTGSPEVTVNLVWSADVATDDPEMPTVREMGQSDTTTSDVNCF